MRFEHINFSFFGFICSQGERNCSEYRLRLLFFSKESWQREITTLSAPLMKEWNSFLGMSERKETFAQSERDGVSSILVPSLLALKAALLGLLKRSALRRYRPLLSVLSTSQRYLKHATVTEIALNLLSFCMISWFALLRPTCYHSRAQWVASFPFKDHRREPSGRAFQKKNEASRRLLEKYNSQRTFTTMALVEGTGTIGWDNRGCSCFQTLCVIQIFVAHSPIRSCRPHDEVHILFACSWSSYVMWCKGSIFFKSSFATMIGYLVRLSRARKSKESIDNNAQ